MTNEAAERLRRLAKDRRLTPETLEAWLDEALAEARREGYREGRLSVWDDIAAWAMQNHAVAKREVER